MLQQQQLVGERCCRLNKPYLKSPEGIIRALLIVIIDNICFSILSLNFLITKKADFMIFIMFVIIGSFLSSRRSLFSSIVYNIPLCFITLTTIVIFLVRMMNCVNEMRSLEKPWNIFVFLSWIIFSFFVFNN